MNGERNYNDYFNNFILMIMKIVREIAQFTRATPGRSLVTYMGVFDLAFVSTYRQSCWIKPDNSRVLRQNETNVIFAKLS